MENNKLTYVSAKTELVSFDKGKMAASVLTSGAGSGAPTSRDLSAGNSSTGNFGKRPGWWCWFDWWFH